ncbi:Tyrosine kinase domain-containing protein [Rhizoctonia solani]|uniref:Tyrosine kinase domain-containing protein n=1 Tax=Rhizoctonia solani TaxID=456999 RepID=A0A8H8NW98_9AGAM|nr:Tyrosine kinase domain-containing protein [Rhizoctonia solani]QRW21094.1 Tyrosine kinase domain-containing protein [Rhizoctonia solani]
MSFGNTSESSERNAGAWVTRDTPLADILLNLTLQNIPDLTKEIDLDLASTTPFATGGSADIFRGHYNGELIAIKVPRLDQKHPEDDGRKIAARGVYNWSKCRHPNIHQLLGFTIFHSRVGMVSPYEKNGNFRHYLATNTTSIQERLDLICKGASYLHQSRIVHGDIKGNNVLISGDGIAMLTDFDNAELEEQSLIFTRTGRLVLSPRWTAPEVILGLTGKTLEADVYSLAMTILEMMTCKAPWANIPTDIGVVSAVLLQKKVPPRPTSIVRGDLWAILVDCWKHEQNARPGPADILKMNTISSPIPEREPIAIAYPRPFLLPVPPGLSLVGNGGEIPGSSRSKGFIRPSLAGHHPQPRSRFRFHFHFRFHFRFRFRFRFPGPCAAPDVNSPGEPLEFSEVDFLSQENPEPDIPSQRLHTTQKPPISPDIGTYSPTPFPPFHPHALASHTPTLVPLAAPPAVPFQPIPNHPLAAHLPLRKTCPEWNRSRPLPLSSRLSIPSPTKLGPCRPKSHPRPTARRAQNLMQGNQ